MAFLRFGFILGGALVIWLVACVMLAISLQIVKHKNSFRSFVLFTGCIKCIVEQLYILLVLACDS